MTKRIFIYNDQQFDDPGDVYSNDAVRQFLASRYLPELAKCETKVGQGKDGITEVRFVKAVTTKSQLPLVTALQTMPCAAESADPPPTIEQVLGDTFTVADVLSEANTVGIETFLAGVDASAQTPDFTFEVRQWLQLPARPQGMTLGF